MKNKKLVLAYTRRRTSLIIPDNLSLEDMLTVIGGCYGDLFCSTRQKMAAYRYWRYFNQSKKESIEEAIEFFFNKTTSADFIRYCADAEGYDNPCEYLLSLVRS